MNTHPTEVQHFVKLITKKELPKKLISLWYKIVQKYFPDGIITSVNESDDKGIPRDVKVIHRKNKNGEHHYIIPLLRHVQDNEAKDVVEKWQRYYKKHDWNIILSKVKEIIPQIDDKDVQLKDDEFDNLCYQISKVKHNDWYKSLIDNGWRYGIKYSEKFMTHPLLMSWDNLPDKWKIVDKKFPKLVVQKLNDYGYSLKEK